MVEEQFLTLENSQVLNAGSTSIMGKKRYVTPFPYTR